LIRLFLQNLFIYNLLLLPYITILRIRSLIYPPSYDEIVGISPVLNYIYLNVPPLALSILAILLIFIQANLINYFTNSNKLHSKNSLVAGMVYALGMCLLPNFLILHPIIIANTFIIMMLIFLTSIYKKYKPINHLFLTGFFTGVSIIIMPHYIFIILFLLQGLLIFRDINLKEFLQAIVGVIIPLFLMGTYFWITRDEPLGFLNLNFQLPKINFEQNTRFWVGFLISAGAVIYIIVNQNILRKKKSAKSQKVINLLYILMIYPIPITIFDPAMVTPHATLLIIPMSILYSVLLFVTKRLILAEIVHIALIVFIFLLQFQVIL